MNKIIQFFQLLWTKVKVFILNLAQYLQEVWHYYGYWRFAKTDLLLFVRYLWKNPYQLCRAFFEEKGRQNPYLYGETPLVALESIAKKCQLSPDDCLFELGSGRGRTCFWLHLFVGCKVVGIECVPEFVAEAEYVRKKQKLEGIEFRNESFLETDFSKATAIYLYGTSFEEKEMAALSKRLESLKPGTKIISVSFPLQGPFTVISRFNVRYTWGKADLFLQVKK